MADYLKRFEKLFWIFLWSLLFDQVARIEFFLWNGVQFKNKATADILWAFFLGLRFDIASSLMLLAPVILISLAPWSGRGQALWRRLGFFVYILPAAGFLIMNLMDLEFINFSGRRFTYDALFILGEAPGRIGGMIATYWWMFLLNSAIVITFTWGVRRIFRREVSQASGPTTARGAFASIAISFVVLVLAVIGIRGGLQSKPLNIVGGHVFTEAALNNLVLNTTFTFLKSYGAESLSREVYFQDRSEMLKYMNGSITGPSLLEGHRLEQPQNVVVIILESFSREYMGEINGDKGYTPFLDSLVHKSLFFKNGFANGRRSIEGVPAVLSGIPTLMNDSFITSPFSANRFVGLGTYLKEKGYSTSFFHGGHNGTMYFDAFAKSAGQDRYFGFNEFPDKAHNDDGTWGIYDEPFYHFMNSQLSLLPQPFFASVFSLSSHQPYRIPDVNKGQFPKGPIEILESVAYADYSLQKFFEEAEKQPWYRNTLFVITADHTSLNYRSGYQNEISRYRVPIVFFHPSFEWPQEIDRDQVVQQIDILPSVLDFVGIKPTEANYLARSAFIPGEHTGTAYIDNRYLLMSKDYFLDWFKGAPIKMYSLDDPAETKELVEPAAVKSDLSNRLKASIQYFNEAMWNNRLYYPLH